MYISFNRKLIRSVATWGMSAKEARKTYAIDDHAKKLHQVKEAMAMANNIQLSLMKLAKLEDTALLQTMGILDEPSSESDTDASGDESNVESDSDCESGLCEVGNETLTSAPKEKGCPDEDATASNPVPRNETLLSWLRENKLNWFSFVHDLRQHLKHYDEEDLSNVFVDFTE